MTLTSSLNWDDLRFFLSVARAGSLSGSARALGVRHTTVARRLRSLEEELGVRLFDRVQREHRLTPAGEDLFGAALRIEQEVRGVDRRLLGRDEDLRGVLRVSTADAMATTFLMPILADFARRHPEVDLRVMVSNDYVSLTEREADLVIRASNSPPEQLIGRRVARLAFAVYGARGYLEGLDGAPRWIGAEGGMPNKAWIAARVGEQSPALTVDEATLTHAAIRAGVGVGLMPCFMGDPDPALIRHLPPEDETRLDLWVLIHSDLKRTARVRVFRDFVIERLLGLLDLLEGRATAP